MSQGKKLGRAAKGMKLGRGSGGASGKGYEPGKMCNPIAIKRSLTTRQISSAMLDQMGQPVEKGMTFAGRIGVNAVIILDSALERCRENGKFDREVLPLLSFVKETLEGRATQPIKDLTKDVESRSDADLIFYLAHKHFPEDPCNCSEIIRQAAAAPKETVVQ